MLFSHAGARPPPSEPLQKPWKSRSRLFTVRPACTRAISCTRGDEHVQILIQSKIQINIDTWKYKYKIHETRPSKKCEFCNYLLDKSLISKSYQSGSIGQCGSAGPSSNSLLRSFSLVLEQMKIQLQISWVEQSRVVKVVRVVRVVHLVRLFQVVQEVQFKWSRWSRWSKWS